MIETHLVFISLLVGSEAFFTGLSILNVRYGERAVSERAAWIDEMLDIEDSTRLLRYNRLKTGFGLLGTWVTLGVLLLVLYSGLFGDAVTALEGVEAVAATGVPSLARGVVFFLGVVIIAQLASIPFDVVDTFVVEEIFDFNRQRPGLFVRDAAVSLVVTLAFTAVLGGAVLAFIGAFPTLWWIAAWALFVGFSLAMLVIYPRVIAPLFNDFEPVDSGDLYQAVMDVFDRAGFSCSQIYVMDASRRSAHSNAYFIGFGRTKRVVLFDTLVEQMDLEEIESVLAHELAHWKNAHIWKQTAASAIRVGVVLLVFSLLLDQPWLYTMFGVPTGAEYAGLLLAGLWIYPINRLTAPLENKLSLKHEREADAFAVGVMNDGQPMIDALARLVSENLSNPFPHPLYATFHYTHPPVPDRIRYIQQQAGDRENEPAD